MRLLPLRLRRGLHAGTNLRAVLANWTWLMVDRLLRMVLAILVGSWVARHLGPSRYGELAYGVALIALWQALSNLGLDSILVRDIAREPKFAHRLLGTALRLRLTSGLLCWSCAVASVAVLRHGDVVALAITAILGGTLVFQASEVVDLWFQSQTSSRSTVLPRSVSYCLASVVKIGLILADAPVWAFAGALLSETVFAAGALAYAYRTHPTAAIWDWNGRYAAAMLRESWPFMLAGLSVVIYMRIDQLVLRTLSNPHELGLYSAMIPFSQAWQIIPMTVCASVLPRLSVLKESNPALYTHRLLQLFSSMLWLGIAVASFTALCAPWIVSRLLGAAYADSVGVLQWHAFTNVFVFLGIAQSVAIVSDRTSRIALIRTVFGAVASLGFNLLLVPEWGAIGAAWAALAAYFCAAVLSNVMLAPAYLRLQVKALWPFHAQFH